MSLPKPSETKWSVTAVSPPGSRSAVPGGQTATRRSSPPSRRMVAAATPLLASHDTAAPAATQPAPATSGLSDSTW